MDLIWIMTSLLFSIQVLENSDLEVLDFWICQNCQFWNRFRLIILIMQELLTLCILNIMFIIFIVLSQFDLK